MMNYKFDILAKPDFSSVKITIPAGEKLKVEASSMSSMDSNISMKTKLKGGLGRFLSNESVFINEFTSEGADGEIMLSPGPSGDIAHYDVTQGDLFLTSSSFVASGPNVNIDSKFQGFAKGFFSGEGLFIMKCSGQGDVWFNSYGAIIEVDIEDEYFVDTGHIVAFTSGLDYEVKSFGGYKSFFFSGEGFIARFKGKGRVWIQSKQPYALVSWADRYRRIEKRNNN